MKKENVFWMLGIATLILFDIYMKAWSYLIMWGVSIFLLIIFYNLSPEIKKRYIKVPFIIGGIGLVFGGIFNIFFLTCVGLVGIFSGLAFVKYMPKSKNKDYKSLHNKIKQDLDIKFVKSYKKKFPKIFSWLGGLIIPCAPVMTLVNTNWKKRLNKEAIIHENCHIHLLLHKNWMIYLLSFAAFIGLFAFWIANTEFMGAILMLFSMVIFFICFEWKTFELTQEMAQKYGIKTRTFTLKQAKKYFKIYTVQLSFLLIFFYLLNKLIGGIL